MKRGQRYFAKMLIRSMQQYHYRRRGVTKALRRIGEEKQKSKVKKAARQGNISLSCSVNTTIQSLMTVVSTTMTPTTEVGARPTRVRMFMYVGILMSGVCLGVTIISSIVRILLVTAISRNFFTAINIIAIR